jgi:hypothetical protein
VWLALLIDSQLILKVNKPIQGDCHCPQETWFKTLLPESDSNLSLSTG